MFKNKCLCNVLTGMAIGTTIGILYAPKSGKETRKDLMNMKDDMMKKMKDFDFDEEKEKFEKKLKELNDDLMDLDAEDVIDMAKKKIRKIKRKTNDLIEMAKESGDEILTNTANDIKEKVTDTVKTVLEKLEDQD